LSAPAAPTAAPPLRLAVDVRTLERAMLWLCGFSGFVVFIEPSPYEGVLAVAMMLFAITGLRIGAAHAPLILLIFFYQLGACISYQQVVDKPDTLTWVLTGIYLAVTGIFYALVITEDTEGRLHALMRGYVVGAVICAAIAVPAYFHLLPDSEQYLLYERVRSTFKDPNVYGPFLILPTVVLFQQVLTRGLRGSLTALLAIAILAIGIFLSFSRAAWGSLVFATLAMVVLTFFQSRSRRERRRIVRLTVIGAAVLVLVLLILLSIPAIYDLFVQRADVAESYDLGHFGRFHRYVLGFLLALDKPIGIGMLQFAPLFTEDTHNTFLNAFMSYGWLGGVMFPALVLSTIAVGALALRWPSPWRPTLVCIYVTYLAAMGESAIIDTDHWRHVHLLQGLVWGLGIASARWARSPASAQVGRRRDSNQPAPTTTA
jgi:hypothetical protein